MKNWNAQQQEILADAATGTGDTVVIARAGTGKTTTMLGACERFPAGCSIVFLAFNSRIKEEVARKAPPGVDVRTLHSLGRGALYGYCKGRRKTLPEPNERKTPENIERLWPESTKAWRGALAQACAFAKNTLATTTDAIEEIVYRLDLDFGVKPGSPEYGGALVKFCDDTLVLLEAEVTRFERFGEYNFDDMIWLPVRLGIRVKQYDRVIVDEGQDLNAAQHALARMARREGGRIVLVGDDRQAIYAWRGADEDGIKRFTDELNAKVLRLPVTYRCGRAIVDLARTMVPDYEAAPTNCDGVIDSAKVDTMLDKAEAGDAILSRVNAPLVGLCLDFLKRGKRARVVGRDIGKQLLALLSSAEKDGATTIVGMLAWISEWCRGEVERIEGREPPGDADPIRDRAACIEALSEGARTVGDVRARIEDLFTDDPGRGEIVLSSTHKAKGLEWPTVWLLRETYRPSRSTEEANLYYVAVTRAISRLVLVSDRHADPPPPVATLQPPASPAERPADPDAVSPFVEALLSGATVVCHLPPPGSPPGLACWSIA